MTSCSPLFPAVLALFWAVLAACSVAQANETSAAPAKEEIGLMPGVPLAPHDVDRTTRMGVIDSGVRPEHPQIGNIVAEVRDFTGEGPGDFHGHGTRVVLVLLHSHYKEAPALARLGTPVRPAELAVARVIGAKRASAQVVADRMADAILWLGGLQVWMVNISLSLPNGAADYKRLCAIMAAQEHMIFVIAAGNSGEQSVVYPAACEIANKIVVGVSSDYSGPSEILAPLPPAPLDAAEYWLGEGTTLYRGKDFAGARRAFETGLQSNPDPAQRARLAYNLGVIALDAGDEGRAAERFDEATRSAPSFAESYVALAIIHIRHARFEGARAVLELGIAAGADSARLRDRLARVLLDLDRPRDALRQMDEVGRQEGQSQELSELRQTAEAMVQIEDLVAQGQSPLALARTFADMDAAQLVRFIIQRWRPALDTIPPGAAVPLLVTSTTKGQRAIVRLLLDSGASVDAHDPQNRVTALMMAAAKGLEQLCRTLLARGADPERRDYFGFTPLMFAAEAGHAGVVKLLLELGVTTTVKSNDGLDAIDYARKFGHREVAEMIAAARQR